MNQTDKNTTRLIEMETSLMHLQNDFDSINEVVLDQARRIGQLNSMLERLTERFDAAVASESPRTAEDEKPPHY